VGAAAEGVQEDPKMEGREQEMGSPQPTCKIKRQTLKCRYLNLFSVMKSRRAVAARALIDTWVLHTAFVCC